VAGSDTTASAIRATLLHVITAPRIEAKLLDEIRHASASSPITQAEARNLPYLQAVIKEGLRIFPPVASLMTKTAPPGGDVWNGVVIPDGTHVGVSVWGMYRRKDLWGEDSDVFRPERWLETGEEKLKEMELTILQNFGSGKWTCLGREIALIEASKAIFEVS
jgi:cytochrome P450